MTIIRWTKIIMFLSLFLGLTLGLGFYSGSNVNLIEFIFISLIVFKTFQSAIEVYDRDEGVSSLIVTSSICFYSSFSVGFLIYHWHVLLA